jgi:phage shock protein A
MGLAKRLASTLSAKANELLDRYDDPKAAIDYAYQRLFEELERMGRARSRLDDAIEGLRHNSDELEMCAAELEGEAQSAAVSGRADMAREALARRLVLTNGVASLGAEQTELRDEENRLVDAATFLETERFVGRAQIEAVKARFMASGDRSEIDETLLNLEKDRAAVAAAVQRAEDRAEQVRAQSARIEALVTTGGVRDLSRSPVPIENEVALARKSVEADQELHEPPT